MSAAELPLEAEEFLTWLAVERGRAQTTLVAYRTDLRQYVAFLATQGQTLASASESDIERYVHAQRASGRAASSVTRALVAVRTMHRFLVDEGRATSDPAADIDAPRKPASLPKALKEDEVAQLLAAVVGVEPSHRRDRAILELLYATGMRISELTGLSLADIDAETGVIRVFGKGSKERIVPFGRFAAEALADWLGVSGQRGHGARSMGAARRQRGRVLEPTWRSADSAGGMGSGAALRRRGRPWRSAQSACAAALVRDSSPGTRCRPSDRAGTARPRLNLNHPGVHTGIDRSAASSLSGRPPSSPSQVALSQ